ncbi:NYN domain-containing protein [Aquibium oceanicum]|uniref:NYN domain-containing protein n=1 Tax=Aquibium oceanicum TaxID=1670800 RepID=A0A1L3SUN7_9HYPH|nr:NYN domain-containing protein [Aquibium oceanicum]APH73022.1 hypothetical protein BSQ44_17845 [Aquibium oceanicum]
MRELIAVLIDGENVASSHIAAIMKKAESIGEPVTGCVVGDFSANRLGEWARAAPRHALELVYQPSCGKGMNSADIALTIRAMDLLASGAFRGFLLVSSDRDFAPLALRLRRAGVAVYGMGEAKAGGAWRNACTQFFDLVAIPTGTPATATGANPATIEKQAAPPNTAWGQQDREAVRGILRSSARDGASWVKLSQLGQSVRDVSKELGARLGNGKLLKNLRTDASVEVRGQGSGIVVRLKPCEENGPATIRAPAAARAAGPKRCAGVTLASVE